MQVTHPRYFGLFNPSVTLASVVADTLVAMYNPQLANWRTSPAANEMERHTLGWLAAKFGLPEDAIATFTSGGTEANLSAVIVALTRAFPDYGEHGLRHLTASPSIYLTEETHHSFSKIAHMTGLGRRRCGQSPTDCRSEDEPGRTEEARRRGSAQWVAPFHGCGHRGNNGGWRDRSVAGAWAVLPGAGPMVSRRCRLGWSCHPLPKLRHLSRRNRAPQTPSLAMRTSGSRFPWDAECSSAGTLRRVAEAFRADVSYMPGKKR